MYVRRKDDLQWLISKSYRISSHSTWGPRFCLKVLKKRLLTRVVISVTRTQARYPLNVTMTLWQN